MVKTRVPHVTQFLTMSSSRTSSRLYRRLHSICLSSTTARFPLVQVPKALHQAGSFASGNIYGCESGSRLAAVWRSGVVDLGERSRLPVFDRAFLEKGREGQWSDTQFGRIPKAACVIHRQLLSQATHATVNPGWFRCCIAVHITAV